MTEPSQIINHLVRSLGVPVHEATAFVEVMHEIVEEQVTDDVSVIAPPLLVARFGCPVLDRLTMRLEDPRWTLPESVDIPPAQLAELLRLPVDVVEAYPVIGRFGLLAKCLDRLSVADEDAERHLRMLDTWLATYNDTASGRDFEVLPTGSREAFRGWLLDRLDLLGRYGYPAKLADVMDDGSTGAPIPSTTDGAPTWSRGSSTTATSSTRATGWSSSTRPRPSATPPTTSWPRTSTGCAPSRFAARRLRGARPAHRRRRQPVARAGAARAGVRAICRSRRSATGAGCAATRASRWSATRTLPPSPTRPRCGWGRSRPSPAEAHRSVVEP